MSEYIVAVDIGNSAVHATAFEMSEDRTPRPLTPAPATVRVGAPDEATRDLLAQVPESSVWWTVSVNRACQLNFRAWLQAARPRDGFRELSHRDSPIPVLVDAPEKLGMDRLAAGVGANNIRPDNSAAIIVDSGTAITIDAVDSLGRFLGGAIFPGVGMAAAALDERTDRLPHIIPVNAPPPSIGAHTEAAIHSGLFWGTFGAVQEIIGRHRETLGESAEVMLTGGAVVWESLLPEAQLLPNLTLQGVAEMAAHVMRRENLPSDASP